MIMTFSVFHACQSLEWRDLVCREVGKDQEMSRLISAAVGADSVATIVMPSKHHLASQKQRDWPLKEKCKSIFICQIRPKAFAFDYLHYNYTFDPPLRVSLSLSSNLALAWASIPSTSFKQGATKITPVYAR